MQQLSNSSLPWNALISVKYALHIRSISRQQRPKNYLLIFVSTYLPTIKSAKRSRRVNNGYIAKLNVYEQDLVLLIVSSMEAIWRNGNSVGAVNFQLYR